MEVGHRRSRVPILLVHDRNQNEGIIKSIVIGIIQFEKEKLGTRNEKPWKKE